MTPQTEHLRTTLHRLADTTVPLPVDDDLWGRAQSARRRGQALAVAAVLVLVVTVGGVASVWPTADRQSRTAAQEAPGGAIPRVIADVPDDLEPTSDLAVGRASAAFVSADGDPVVVTATDGVPHALAIPGWDPRRRVLQLSPDGARLAYQRTEDSYTDIASLDLTTGEETLRFRQPGESLTYDTLAWSPRGDWLAWSASQFGDARAVGKVGPPGARVLTIALPFTPTSVAVTDDGSLAVASAAGALYLPEDGERGLGRVDGAGPAAVGAFSPDGRRLALNSGPGTASTTLDTRTEQVLQHPFPDDTLGESVVRPLGWIDDRIQLLLVQPVDGSGAELVVTTPEVDDQSTWRRRVGSVETSGVANSLSVAVDLVPDLDGTSSQELTHDFGATTTPERDVSWMVGLGVAGAIAGLMALRWLWRRLRTPV